MTSTKRPRVAMPVQASLFDDFLADAAQATLDEPPLPEIDPRQITIFSLFGADEFPAPERTHAVMPAPAMPHDPTAPQAAIDTTRLEDQFDALPAAWRELLAPFITSDAYAPLCRFVDDERAAGKTVYPADVF
ncbi:hypothetical protein AB3X93_33490, partial [Paraburkholderia sp. BR14262]